MDGSDSEDSHARGRAPKTEADGIPPPEGAVIVEGNEAAVASDKKEDVKDDKVTVGAGDVAPAGEGALSPEAAASAKKEEAAGVEEGGGSAPAAAQSTREPTPAVAKPSYTLHVRNLPADLDLNELEMRLKRFGDVVALQQEEGMVVVKYSRTNDAYKAREKLNGSSPYGSNLQVDFGPQDSEHYNRGKKRMLGKVRKEFLDSEGPGAETAPKPPSPQLQPRAAAVASKAELEPTPAPAAAEAGSKSKRKKPDTSAAEAENKQHRTGEPGMAADARGRGAATFTLTPPSKAASKWSQELSFEEQLEDFMKMPRRGMYNRYLVLGKLPPELRTGEAIWRAMHPVQRDIVQVEMLTCFSKPVAHVSLRSATAAAAMHRLCEQLHSNLTVAFAPPRRSSATLWLGNVDDFVSRKELEVLLQEYGRVINGLRYLPARTCAFSSFAEVSDAVAARNALYGLEVQRNQYLNVDFVEEGEHWGGDHWGMWGAGPWAAPWAPAPWAPRPWGPAPGPWGAAAVQPQWRGGEHRRDDRWRGAEPMRPPAGPWGVPPCGRSPPRLVERREQEKRRGRRHSRSRSHGRRSDREASPERGRRREPSEQRHAARSGSETVATATATAAEARSPKARVKLYKMGEFCCNIVANYVKGKENPEPLVTKLHIDQRTKVDHCRAHLERAGALATVWHFSAADRRDCAAYDALCDYFVEKQRVGLVQTPSYYIYIVPPTEQYLKDLSLPTSNFVVGLQIPIKK